MVGSNHDIVCTWVIMSPTRRPDDHDYKRTNLAPRSDQAALARRTPLRDLSRLEPRHLVLRQMVGRISAQSPHRLCRAFACPAPLAPADACDCRASRAQAAADARTGHDTPHALRLDWCACDQATPQGIARVSL